MSLRKSGIILIFLSALLVDGLLYARSRGSFGSGRVSRGSKISWGSQNSGGYTSKAKPSSMRASERSQGIKQASSFSSQVRSPAKNGWGSGMKHGERVSSYQSRFSGPTTIINHNYHTGPWGSWGWGFASVGIWDLFFLSTVSHLFWYHHWHDPALKQALYEKKLLDQQELERLESRVKELEAQKIPRDPNYLPDDVSHDVAHSKEYLGEKKEESFINQEYYFWALALFGLALGYYFIFYRRY